MPVVDAYRRGKVVHIGDFEELERQMNTWRLGRGYSPDRMDALVWLVTRWLPYLSGVVAAVATGSEAAGKQSGPARDPGTRIGRTTGGSSGRRLGVPNRRQ